MLSDRAVAIERRYSLSDRLGEARTQSVAGRNKIEYSLSDRLGEARTQSVAGRNKIEYSPIMQSNFFMRTSSHPPSADNEF